MLCERHRPGVKPTVDHLRHSLHRLAAVRAGEGDLVDVRAVELHVCMLRIPAALRELGAASDGLLMSATLTLPDVERCAPVAVPRDAPVLNIFEPVAEASFSDGLGNPVDRIVVADQIVLDRRHLDKPGLARIINERRVASPAVRILMLKLRRVKEKPFPLQISQNQRIRFFYKNARVSGLLGQLTFSVYELNERKIIFSSHIGVVLAERRCNVNNTCTVRHGNVAVASDVMRFFPLLLDDLVREIKQRFILLALKITAPVSLKYLIGLNRAAVLPAIRAGSFCSSKPSEDFLQEGFCHVVSVPVRSFYLAVSLIRVHAEGDIRRQCPRCCRPCQKVRLLAHHFKACDCRALLDRLIALRHLLGGKRRSATRTVGNNLESFVQ